MSKMESKVGHSLKKIITNNIEGNSIEKFIKQKMLLNKASTMKTRTGERLSFVLTTTSRSENNVNKKEPRKKLEKYKNSKVKFIDEIEKKKPLCEIINIESFKSYNIDISEEGLNQQCTCIII